MDATLSPQAIQRGGGQVIPTARRACYSSFLMASPRLMEPVYQITVVSREKEDSEGLLTNILARRRGHILETGRIAGTPLSRVRGLVPVIDSFGLETEVRIRAKRLTEVSLVFERWDVVPGDPLDRTALPSRPLQPASAQALARDFVLKTRRRKGLSEDVSVAKFLEPELYKSLVEGGALD
jgi:116 kDa U5 small nuclear ribonucleoprotein component